MNYFNHNNNIHCRNYVSAYNNWFKWLCAYKYNNILFYTKSAD